MVERMDNSEWPIASSLYQEACHKPSAISYQRFAQSKKRLYREQGLVVVIAVVELKSDREISLQRVALPE